MSDTTPTPTAGTAPAGSGPGTATALTDTLNAYLTQQLVSGTNNSQPLPSAPVSPAPVVIQAPAAAAPDSRPIMALSIILAVLGAIGAVAYLADRRKAKK